MRVLALSSAIVLGSLAGGCAALGPKANVSVVNAEIKSTKTVDNIIIPAVTGVDATGNTGKALLATCLKAYGTRSRPMAAASALVSAIPGAPAGLSDILTAGYQAEFIQAVDQFQKDGKKPESLKLPSTKLDFEVPAGIDGVKTIVPKLTGEVAAIGELAGALKSGNSGQLSTAMGKSQTVLPLVQRMTTALFENLDVTYVLLTHVVGDEAAWNAGKEVHYVAALVNAKTGKMRYFANVKAKKGAIPTPYMAQLGIMSSSLFDAVSEKDPLPEKAAAEDDSKSKKSKKKKTAALDVSVEYY